MRRYLLLLIALLSLTPAARAGNEPDSLLRTLDRAIAERSLRTARKEELLRELKQQRDAQESLRDRYRINDEIIDNYTSFVCDSATSYIHDNLRIAETLGDERLRTESRLRLAFVYSLSGLFVQASDLLRAIDFGALTADQKLSYCWTRIRYYENLTRYTGDEALGADYAAQIGALRDTVMSLLPEDSEMYLKEKAFQLQADGRLEEAEGILTEIYRGQTPDTHSYAMAAMSLAKLYREAGDRERENRFLKLAALTDTRLAVKENEALLTLATNLFEQGDIERSYNYISSALSDANFYNSRVKNSVIARVQPIIESNYLDRIETQRRNLRRSTILLSVFIALLAGALAVIGIQMRMVSRARRNLQEMNGQLSELNRSLNEANVVKGEIHRLLHEPVRPLYQQALRLPQGCQPQAAQRPDRPAQDSAEGAGPGVRRAVRRVRRGIPETLPVVRGGVQRTAQARGPLRDDRRETQHRAAHLRPHAARTDEREPDRGIPALLAPDGLQLQEQNQEQGAARHRAFRGRGAETGSEHLCERFNVIYQNGGVRKRQYAVK